jgi:hypothetical protein
MGSSLPADIKLNKRVARNSTRTTVSSLQAHSAFFCPGTILGEDVFEKPVGRIAPAGNAELRLRCRSKIVVMDCSSGASELDCAVSRIGQH